MATKIADKPLEILTFIPTGVGREPVVSSLIPPLKQLEKRIPRVQNGLYAP